MAAEPRIPDASPFLVIREATPPDQPHFYDVILAWVAENFPEFSPLFRIETLPYRIAADERFSLHIPWLQDPVQAWSMETYELATHLAGACDALGIPVVNRVDRLINTTKSVGAQLMAECGFRVPRMARIDNAEEFRETALGVPLPLFVRDDWGHFGDMLRANTLEDVRSLPIERFERPVAIELIETRDPRDGYYRKYRYVAAGDVGVTHHLQLSTAWITRSPTRVRGDNARYEELDYIGRPDPNHSALQRARRALGLDFVAFDYSYDSDGRIVVWEGNPYPGLHFSTRGLTYRNAAMHRTFAAILRLYLDRAGIPSPARLDAQLDYTRAPSVTWTGVSAMPVPRRERVPVRAMRCLGEVSIKMAPGDRLFLAIDCPKRALTIVARKGRSKTVALRIGPVPAGERRKGYSLTTSLKGHVRITLLVEDSVAGDVLASGLRLVRPRSTFDNLRRLWRTPREESAERTGWRAFRRSGVHSCPAVVVASGAPVDQFRLISSASKRERYGLVVLEIDDGTTFPRLGRASIPDAPSRHCDVDPGATIVPNPLANAGACVVLFVPSAGAKGGKPRSSIHAIEGWRIVETLGI